MSLKKSGLTLGLSHRVKMSKTAKPIRKFVVLISGVVVK